MRHLLAWLASAGQAHNVSNATVSSEPAYATLYATCAALMIAVLVVFYFDKNVRNLLTARQRGYAIGSLGGIIGTGLLLCLFVLAGMVKDTTSTRGFIAIYTLTFLTFVFGAAINAWGREDAAMRQQSSIQITVPPAVIPRGAATEKERAAELVAAGLFILGQSAPAAVLPGLEIHGPIAEKERLRLLTNQWMTMQPELIAIGAWHPSVRESSTRFLLAGHEALKQTGSLFADPHVLSDEKKRIEWQRIAEAAYKALETEWEAFIDALNTGADSASSIRRIRVKRAFRLQSKPVNSQYVRAINKRAAKKNRNS